MALTPIHNMVMINQNAPNTSVQHANNQVKLDFQLMVNLQSMQDKENQIQEIRPTEETTEINEDSNKKNQQEQQQEQQAKQEETNAENDTIEKNPDGTILHLNISV